MPVSTSAQAPVSVVQSVEMQDKKQGHVATSNPYDFNVVMDLEFTSLPKMLWQETGLSNEIIEVGAVKMAPDGTSCGEFGRIVRPTVTNGVSGWTHRLTGIGNEDFAHADTLGEVLEELSSFIGPGRIRMVTWSNSDLKQITEECSLKGIDYHLPSRWLDIQVLYSRLMGLDRHRTVALGRAAEWLGIDAYDSMMHRALYDAQVTSEVFRMMATGEYKQHRDRLKSGVKPERKSLSASIGSQCGELAELLTRMRGQEQSE